MRYLALGALLAACGGSDGVGPTSSPRSVRLIPDTATIGREATLSLLALEVDGRAIAPQALQWASADVAVAVVDPAGVVRGIAAGQVEIRATAGAAADTARITVLPFISLGNAEPADINAAGRIGGSIGGQPFIWSPAGGVHRLTGLSGTPSGSVRGLSEDGTAVGISGAGGLETDHPVVWTFAPDGSATVEQLPWTGGPSGFAFGVSPAGDRIVGEVFTHPNPTRFDPFAAVWTRGADGEWTGELLPVAPNGFAAGFAVNAAGQVVGIMDIDGPQGFTSNAVVWFRLPDLTWTFEILASGEPGTVSAQSINAAGDIVGETGGRAMLWKRSGPSWTMQDLGDLGGSDFSFAADINDDGAVVGASHDAQGHQRAFIWTPAEGMHDLGSLSTSAAGRAINGAGATVGLSHDGRRIWIGTVWPTP